MSSFEYTDPLFFGLLIVGFHLIVWLAGLDLDVLRKNRWLYEKQEKSLASLDLYRYMDLGLIDWSVLPKVWFNMVGVVALSMIHVPINCPAFSLSTFQKMDMNHEFKIHAVGNFASALLSFSQNYFVYSNSLLLFHMGCRSRLTGVLMAVAIGFIMAFGAQLIGFVPTVLVCTMIIHLTYDLLTESFILPFKSSSWLEYLNLVATSVLMIAIGFMEGIAVGLILSLVVFVVEQKKRVTIRRIDYNGFGSPSICPEQTFLEEKTREGVDVYTMPTELYFVNSVTFIEEILKSSSSWIVLDCSALALIDQSAGHSLVKAIYESKKRWGFVSASEFIKKKLIENGLNPDDDSAILFRDAHQAKDYIENWFLEWNEVSNSFEIESENITDLDAGTRFSIRAGTTVQVISGVLYLCREDSFVIIRLHKGASITYPGSIFHLESISNSQIKVSP